MKLLSHGAVHGAINHGVDARGEGREQQVDKLYRRRNVYQKTKFQNRNDYKRSPTDEKKIPAAKSTRDDLISSLCALIVLWPLGNRREGTMALLCFLTTL